MNYRAAIVGAGAPVAKTNNNLEGFSIGQAHALAYTSHPDVDLVAIADVRPENAKALADSSGGSEVYRSLQELLAGQPGLDVLSVCTWPTLHSEMVLAAVDAGVKMIVCEKPMAVSIAQIDAMQAAANGSGSRVFVNHQRRYEQPYQGAKRLIAGGQLGEILRVDGQVGDGWDLMSWGSHWVDMARYLLGAEPEWLFAAAQMSGKHRYGHLVEDEMLLQLGFPSGASAFIHTGARLEGAALIVTGTDGSLRIAGNEAHLTLAKGDVSRVARDHLTATPSAHGYFGAFIEAISDVIVSYERQRPSLIDIESGHADTEIMLGAYQSAATRSVLRLPLLDRSTDLHQQPTQACEDAVSPDGDYNHG